MRAGRAGNNIGRFFTVIGSENEFADRVGKVGVVAADPRAVNPGPFRIGARATLCGMIGAFQNEEHAAGTGNHAAACRTVAAPQRSPSIMLEQAAKLVTEN